MSQEGDWGARRWVGKALVVAAVAIMAVGILALFRCGFPGAMRREEPAAGRRPALDFGRGFRADTGVVARDPVHLVLSILLGGGVAMVGAAAIAIWRGR
jgi:hypothetical protein